ncbi:hypothetical protein [Phytomonospora endophytica]|uniref:Uncharacterized protein n=1 Tax=Phytomonospora endophytica TaxID=714109 RepID=A0A841FR27_9ACTN|nr:hypothetical protein [Phytomonospora endophytica]MBB6038645.1 hypothetical protein [Phytomonospora endophytica]GIG69210.1 hypothetical protein Pen01_55050 [Phytomonospora endophytica]
MAETPREIVTRVLDHRLLTDIRDETDDPLLKEVVDEIMAGRYSWVEAMRSPTYGPSIAAMVSAGVQALKEFPPAAIDDGVREVDRLVELVTEYGEAALDPDWSAPAHADQ